MRLSLSSDERAESPAVWAEGNGLARQPLFGLLALIVSLIAGIYYWRFSSVWTDDALIYFRMARNVDQGLGPVLNAGDSHSGGTSLLWVYVLAAAGRLFPMTGHPELAKALATAFMFGSGVLLSLTLRRAMGPVALLAPVALVSIPLFRMLPGLETPLAVLALSFCCWSAFSVRSLPLSAAALALSFFCRGDAILLGPPLALHYLVRSWREGWPDEARRQVVRAVVIFCVILAVGIALHGLLTGRLLPATLGVKRIQGLGPWPIYGGAILRYVSEGLGGSWWLLPFAFLGIRFGRAPLTALLAAAFLHFVGYSVLSVADYAWYSWIVQLAVRLATVMGVAIAVAGAAGFVLKRVGLRTAGRGVVLRFVESALVLALGLGAVLGGFVSLRPMVFLEPGRAMGGAGFVKTYRDIARFVCHEIDGDGDGARRPVVLAEEIGIIGYHCPDVEIRDVNGLASPGLTRATLNDWDYWIDRYQPEFLAMRGDHAESPFFARSPTDDVFMYHKVLMPHEPDFIPISVYRRDHGSPALRSASNLHTLLRGAERGHDNKLYRVPSGPTVVFSHAPSELVTPIATGASRARIEFGILPAPEEARGKADGVTFAVLGITRSGEEALLMSRHVPAPIQGHPVEPLDDAFDIDLRGFDKLRLVTRPGQISDWDWSYWSGLHYE